MARNTKLTLYQDVPVLGNSIVVDFPTAQAREAYFANNFLKSGHENYMQVSFRENTVRIPLRVEMACGYNYMSYQEDYGTTTPGKLTYCFVTGYKYINENCTEIYYAVDYFTTYMFDYLIQPCPIDRAMLPNSASEQVYYEPIFLTPEPIDIGTEYDMTSVTSYILSSLSAMVVMSDIPDSWETTVEVMDFGKHGGVQNAGYVITGGSNSVSAFLRELNTEDKIKYQDSVVGTTMIPSAFVTTNENAVNIPFAFDREFHGLNPRYVKCRYFPYTYLTVMNASGEQKFFRYEMFNNRPFFRIFCPMSLDVVVTLEPYGYEMPTAYVNHSYALTISGFPMLPYINQSFLAWLAYNNNALSLKKTANVMSYMQSTVPVLANRLPTALASANPVGAVASIASVVLPNAVNLYLTGRQVENQIEAARDTIANRGDSTVTSVNKHIDNGDEGFYFFDTYLPEGVMRSVDNFFHIYGYNFNGFIDYPLTLQRNRPKWNYLKTRDCLITPITSMPLEAIAQIKSIYDGGCIFMHNGIHPFVEDNG